MSINLRNNSQYFCPSFSKQKFLSHSEHLRRELKIELNLILISSPYYLFTHSCNFNSLSNYPTVENRLISNLNSRRVMQHRNQSLKRPHWLLMEILRYQNDSFSELNFLNGIFLLQTLQLSSAKHPSLAGINRNSGKMNTFYSHWEKCTGFVRPQKIALIYSYSSLLNKPRHNNPHSLYLKLIMYIELQFTLFVSNGFYQLSPSPQFINEFIKLIHSLST